MTKAMTAMTAEIMTPLGRGIQARMQAGMPKGTVWRDIDLDIDIIENNSDIDDSLTANVSGRHLFTPTVL